MDVDTHDGSLMEADIHANVIEIANCMLQAPFGGTD